MSNLKIDKSIKSADNKNNNDMLIIWGKRALVCVTLLCICALAVIGVQVLSILSTPVSIVIWTLIFVFLLRNIVNKLDDKGVNRVLGTVIAYVIMLIVVLLVSLFMFSPVFGFSEQIQNFITQIPYYITLVKEFFQGIYNDYGDYLQNPDIQKWINDALSQVGNIGGSIVSAGASGIITVGGFVGGSAMGFGFSLVIAFWVLIELPSLGREANRFIKPKYKEDSLMWKEAFTTVMAGYIKGTFLQCLIIGVASGLLFWALGISNPGALGCITGVLNIIPIFGPWIGGAVAAIGGVFINPWIGLFALVGTICIQQFVYTFISPKIMSDACNIHPALSLMALMAGGAIGAAMSGVIGSLVGMLLSIPFVAVFKSLFIYYYEKKTGRRIVSERGVFFKGIPLSQTETNPMEDALSKSHKKMKKLEIKAIKDAAIAEEKAEKAAEIAEEKAEIAEEKAKIASGKINNKKNKKK